MSMNAAGSNHVSVLRRWTGRLMILVGLVVLAVWLTWYGWRRYAAPRLPDIALDGAEAAVAGAIEAARARVRHDPYLAEAWGDLGKVLRANDYVEAAVACFAQAARLEPENPRWPYLQGEGLMLRHIGSPLKPLRQALALSDRQGDDILAPRLRLAEALLIEGHYDEAQVHLQRALELEPDHPCVHLNLGIVELAQNHLEESRQHLLRCRHSPFTQQKACVHLALVYQRLGKLQEAEEFGRLARVLPRDGHWSDPYVFDFLRRGVGNGAGFRLVQQLEAQGLRDEAVAHLHDMAAQDPDYRVYVELGKNLAHLGRSGEATQALQTAIQLLPDNVQAYSLLSKIHLLMGERTFKEDRDKAIAAYRRGADYARKALHYQDDDGPTHMYLGLCLKRLDQHQEAQNELRRAVECGPENADAWFHLGEALAEEGRIAEARRHLEQAARLAPPNDSRPRDALKRLSAPQRGPDKS